MPEPESSQLQTSRPVVCWNKSEENDPQKTGNISPNKTLFRHWLLTGSIHDFSLKVRRERKIILEPANQHNDQAFYFLKRKQIYMWNKSFLLGVYVIDI